VSDRRQFSSYPIQGSIIGQGKSHRPEPVRARKTPLWFFLSDLGNLVFFTSPLPN